jgi:hypothetical protein
VRNDNVITYPKNQSLEASDTFQAGQKQRAGYVPTYASATISSAEHLTILERIPQNVDAALSRLTTTNYQVDRSVREAILATPEQWREEYGAFFFTSSDRLGIHLGTPRHPLETSAALNRVRELSDSTLLTARIVLGLWNSRRTNPQFTLGSRVAIRLEEVLEWRGIKKHTYLPRPDIAGCTKRNSDGYEAKHKNRVLKDLDLLASCCIYGIISCTFKGKKVDVRIESPYLTYSIVTHKTRWTEGAIAGVFVTPGGWMNAYIEHENYFLAETGRRTFQFHPHQQQHELRLALYLTERWRQLARDGNFAKEISMSELLAASMIPVDRAHLTSQFVPRIEHALQTLWQQKTIGGGAPKPVEKVDKSQLQWGNAWLASRWILPPPPELQAFYEAMLKSSQPQFHLAKTQKGRKRQASTPIERRTHAH